MAGRGGGYTIPMSLAQKLETEGQRSFENAEHGTMTIKTCNRCMGSGRYSFNQIHQDRCYGCGGTGVVAVVGTEEEVAAKEAKKEAARIRSAERKRTKQEAEATARIAENDRIDALLGCHPVYRREPKMMQSRYEGHCGYCDQQIPDGVEIVYSNAAYHPGCYGDLLLDDIENARQFPELPF